MSISHLGIFIMLAIFAVSIYSILARNSRVSREVVDPFVLFASSLLLGTILAQADAVSGFAVFITLGSIFFLAQWRRAITRLYQRIFQRRRRVQPPQ